MPCHKFSIVMHSSISIVAWTYKQSLDMIPVLDCNYMVKVHHRTYLFIYDVFSTSTILPMRRRIYNHRTCSFSVT